MRNIKVFKMNNGDEIVSDTKIKMEGTKTIFVLLRPRQMIVQNTAKGPISGLIPWILSAPDSEVELSEDKFFCQLNVTKEVEDYYLEVTSSIALSL
jgi:hypothetical protein